MGPSPAAAPPGFETALQDFLAPSAVSDALPADPDEAVHSLQRLSAGLKGLAHHKTFLLDANVSQQVGVHPAFVSQAVSFANRCCKKICHTSRA